MNNSFPAVPLFTRSLRNNFGKYSTISDESNSDLMDKRFAKDSGNYEQADEALKNLGGVDGLIKMLSSDGNVSKAGSLNQLLEWNHWR